MIVANEQEYVCEGCGCQVYQCVPVPPETIWCLHCRFVFSLETPQEKQSALEFMRKIGHYTDAQTQRIRQKGNL
jgi:hypothetical protein